MSQCAIICVLGGYLWALSGAAAGAEVPDRGKEIVQWMIAQERAWAEQSCGKPWVLSELLAADFHGTSPKGIRYDRPTEVPTYDPATFHSDCRLLDADVRSVRRQCRGCVWFRIQRCRSAGLQARAPLLGVD